MRSQIDRHAIRFLVPESGQRAIARRHHRESFLRKECAIAERKCRQRERHVEFRRPDRGSQNAVKRDNNFARLASCLRRRCRLMLALRRSARSSIRSVASTSFSDLFSLGRC